MRIKKKQLQKNIRLSLAAVLVVLFAASLLNAYTVYRKPAVVEQNIETYRYTSTGNFSYEVRMKPNSVFQETVLGPGKTYFPKLIEQLNVSLLYRYHADKAAQLKAAYDIVAIVQSPEMWEKKFVLVPFTELFSEGRTISFDKSFSVDLAYFNDLIKSIDEEIGVGAREPKLVIKANIYAKAVSEDGTVQEQFAPAIVIPLSTGSFKVGEEQISDKKEGSLSKNELVNDPALKKNQIISALFALASAAALLAFLFLTRNKTVERSEQEMLLEALRKKYSERMLMVNDEVFLHEKTTVITMNSFEDLVKVADELGKPIIYEKCDPGKLPVYYVFEGQTAYRHALSLQDTGVKSVPDSRPSLPA